MDLPLDIPMSAEMSKPYFIHMDMSMKPTNFSSHEWYESLIKEATSGSDYKGLLLYTYDIVLNGFAAKLSGTEAAALRCMRGCVAVKPSYGQLDEGEIRSARDTSGNGTHCASIAGSAVGVVSFTGQRNGHRDSSCDITAAIEKDISDGVDVISMSIGQPEKPTYIDMN